MFEDKDLDKMMAESEEPLKQLNNGDEQQKNALVKEELPDNAVLDQTQESKDFLPSTTRDSDYIEAVNDTRKAIIEKAKEKINDDKMIEKHSDKIAEITDKALETQAEIEELKIDEAKAENKVKKQEIKNRLIVKKAEAKRLKKEQKQLNKEQKAEHKKRNKDAKWELYGAKLTKMKYDYVPNAFILSMLLFFDGLVGFFKGVGETSTAIVKALKWLIIIGLIIAVLMIIPVTREGLLNLLKFK